LSTLEFIDKPKCLMNQLPKLPRFRNLNLQLKTPRLQIFALLTFILLLVATLFFSTKLASAQVPDPTVPCDQIRPRPLNPFDEDEFHSLRPYQASPCSDETEPSALFCGNDLVLTDTITVRRGDARYCQRFSPTEEECFFRVTQNRQLAIDVSGAELPIMGRTEDDVVNSQNQNETRSDASKINDYVSWYLSGVDHKAEYGFSEEEQVVNYSGPIRKLLPLSIQHKSQIETLNRREVERHDQVVVCANQAFLGLIGPSNVNPCNQGGDVYRLSTWAEEDLSFWNSAINTLENIFVGLLPGVARSAIRTSLGDHWNNRYPPLPWNYDDDKEFMKHYLEWRGNSCILVPFPPFFSRSLFCVDNPLVLNKWADLFSYVPLSSTDEDVNSSTEDRLGQIEVINPSIQAVQPDVTISNVSILTSPADLFFSHMEEAQGLADILQDTYVPQGNPKSGPVVGVIRPNQYCDLTQIRTNPGDDLFAGEIGVNLTYTAEFSCGFEVFDPADPIDTYWCDYLGGRCYTDDYDCDNWRPSSSLICPSGYRCGSPPDSCNPDPPNPSCTRNARVVLNTQTRTPLVDDIWSRLVAGGASVFRRIFPQVGEGAPVEGFYDIPAATGVTYSLNPPVPGVSLTAGNPGRRRGQAAELYFPHIGGIEQYFLQCIQTALRPQGFGEVCPVGEIPEGLVTGVCTNTFPGEAEPPLPVPGARCEPAVAGWCSVSTLRRYFPPGTSASTLRNASIVCNIESGGYTNALNDGCLCGRSVDYSVGLFQINLLPSNRCPGAFSGYTWSPPSCTINDLEALQQCTQDYLDPETNIDKAVRMIMDGQWCSWAAARSCGIATGC